jgi:hypothetical protein
MYKKPYLSSAIKYPANWTWHNLKLIRAILNTVVLTYATLPFITIGTLLYESDSCCTVATLLLTYLTPLCHVTVDHVNGVIPCLWTAAINGPLVPSPPQRYINHGGPGKPKNSEKNLLTTNPTWTDVGANLGHCGERPVTNRLSYGMAYYAT